MNFTLYIYIFFYLRLINNFLLPSLFVSIILTSNLRGVLKDMLKDVYNVDNIYFVEVMLHNKLHGLLFNTVVYRANVSSPDSVFVKSAHL